MKIKFNETFTVVVNVVVVGNIQTQVKENIQVDGQIQIMFVF